MENGVRDQSAKHSQGRPGLWFLTPFSAPETWLCQAEPARHKSNRKKGLDSARVPQIGISVPLDGLLAHLHLANCSSSFWASAFSRAAATYPQPGAVKGVAPRGNAHRSESSERGHSTLVNAQRVSGCTTNAGWCCVPGTRRPGTKCRHRNCRWCEPPGSGCSIPAKAWKAETSNPVKPPSVSAPGASSWS